MQVLYQLSYGPVVVALDERNAGSSAPAYGLPQCSLSLHRHGAHTWRQTATSFPCTTT
jgi:hypothetical protein